VHENWERSRHNGLDFIFATDHGSIRQKPITAKFAATSWGQEPGAKLHHLGLLCNRRRFKPKCDNIAADFARAKAAAPFAWIPHPVGWYPVTWYGDETINLLWTLGPEFPMEVINGASKIVRAYDQFDAKAVKVWDKLLINGRKVAALGASDAHSPDDIGSVWTGIFAERKTAPSIIKALNQGLCFASEASLMDLSCNGRPMGSTLQVKRGAALKFHFRVADSAGLAAVRIISQGKVVKELRLHGKPLADGEWTTKAKLGWTYFRLESTASDDRRAFSTPIYVRAIPPDTSIKNKKG
jgi:hypothetical protein